MDHRRVLVQAGRGGNGVSCFHSEPRKEFGGPDGGDGGNGGHVLLRADQQVKSLSSILSRYQGFDGEDGGRKNCFGRGGSPLYIRVSRGPRGPRARAAKPPTLLFGGVHRAPSAEHTAPSMRLTRDWASVLILYCACLSHSIILFIFSYLYLIIFKKR